MLHTLAVGTGHRHYEECLRLLRADDAVVLVDRGVYLALAGCGDGERLLGSGAAIHVLEADARAAGVTQNLAAGVARCDYAGFVALTEEHSRLCSWY